MLRNRWLEASTHGRAVSIRRYRDISLPIAEEYAKTGNRNIRSRVTSDPNTFHSTIWLFEATYRNF